MNYEKPCGDRMPISLHLLEKAHQRYKRNPEKEYALKLYREGYSAPSIEKALHGRVKASHIYNWVSELKKAKRWEV